MSRANSNRPNRAGRKPGRRSDPTAPASNPVPSTNAAGLMDKLLNPDMVMAVQNVLRSVVTDDDPTKQLQLKDEMTSVMAQENPLESLLGHLGAANSPIADLFNAVVQDPTVMGSIAKAFDEDHEVQPSVADAIECLSEPEDTELVRDTRARHLPKLDSGMAELYRNFTPPGYNSEHLAQPPFPTEIAEVAESTRPRRRVDAIECLSDPEDTELVRDAGTRHQPEIEGEVEELYRNLTPPGYSSELFARPPLPYPRRQYTNNSDFWRDLGDPSFRAEVYEAMERARPRRRRRVAKTPQAEATTSLSDNEEALE